MDNLKPIQKSESPPLSSKTEKRVQGILKAGTGYGNHSYIFCSRPVFLPAEPKNDLSKPVFQVELIEKDLRVVFD